jgi:hypothetical protein
VQCWFLLHRRRNGGDGVPCQHAQPRRSDRILRLPGAPPFCPRCFDSDLAAVCPGPEIRMILKTPEEMSGNSIGKRTDCPSQHSPALTEPSDSRQSLAGYFGPPGAAAAMCPAGSYCPPGSSEPRPCPAKRTSNPAAPSVSSCTVRYSTYASAHTKATRAGTQSQDPIPSGSSWPKAAMLTTILGYEGM